MDFRSLGRTVWFAPSGRVLHKEPLAKDAELPSADLQPAASDSNTTPTTAAVWVDATPPTENPPARRHPSTPAPANTSPAHAPPAASRPEEMRRLATLLLEVTRGLEEANQARRDALQEHSCVPSARSKSALNRANRRCATLRKRRKRLEAQQAAVRCQHDAPSEVAQLSTPQPAPAPAPATSSSPVTVSRPVSRQRQPPAPREGYVEIAALVGELRNLVALAADPAAALTCLDAALRALQSLAGLLAGASPDV